MSLNLPIRLALIGCGLIGSRHTIAWSNVARVSPETIELVAICDTNTAAAEQCAKQITKWQKQSPHIYHNYTELLEAQSLDAVDICLPVYLHHTVACACLERGIHVLVEKPLAISIKAGKLMVETATKTDCILALAENCRYTPAIRTARWIIHDVELIGKPEIFFAQRSRYESIVTALWHWRATKEYSGGGWAIDNGAHLMDTIQYLFGPIDAVAATSKRVIDRTLLKGDIPVIDEREDLLSVLFYCQSGVTGIFSAVKSLPGHDWFLFSIQGRHGALIDKMGHLFHAPDMDAFVQLQYGPPRPLSILYSEFIAGLDSLEKEHMFPKGLHDGFAIECYDFLRAIITGANVEIDGYQGLHTLASSLAIYESAATRTVISVEDVLIGNIAAYQKEIDEKLDIQ